MSACGHVATRKAPCCARPATVSDIRTYAAIQRCRLVFDCLSLTALIIVFSSHCLLSITIHLCCKLYVVGGTCVTVYKFCVRIYRLTEEVSRLHASPQYPQSSCCNGNSWRRMFGCWAVCLCFALCWGKFLRYKKEDRSRLDGFLPVLLHLRVFQISVDSTVHVYLGRWRLITIKYSRKNSALRAFRSLYSRNLQAAFLIIEW